MLYPKEYPSDPLYTQRISEIHASINKKDTYHEKLLKYGWKHIPAQNNMPDMYVRPRYMGTKRKILTVQDALNENSTYTYPYRNPWYYKNKHYENL